MRADLKKWRGLASLVVDAVEHGSRVVERVHIATAERPFAILELIPVVAAPTRVVHAVHNVAVLGTYASIRLVNRAVGATVDVALDVFDDAPKDAIRRAP